MPELPEVEYTARQLRTQVVGATIQDAEVFWERVVGHPQLADFLAEIAGREIVGVRRRGKFLVLDLSERIRNPHLMPTRGPSSSPGCGSTTCSDAPCGHQVGGNQVGVPDTFSGEMFLTIHRRMTGNLLLLPPGWEIDTGLREHDPVAWSTRGPTFHKVVDEAHGSDNSLALTSSLPRLQTITEKETAYCRICFNFADGRRLLYTDLRKFGRVELRSREKEAEAFAGLGPEPLDADFTPERLRKALAGRKQAIKTVLLAQEIVVGVGNIYADEALYYACIHPLRRAHSLTAEEIHVLHQGIVRVLTLGIEHGGTSFSDYRDVWGEAGENFNHVRVYQQDGKPCLRCGTLIERIVLAQRSAHYCPICQPLAIEE